MVTCCLSKKNKIQEHSRSLLIKQQDCMINHQYLFDEASLILKGVFVTVTNPPLKCTCKSTTQTCEYCAPIEPSEEIIGYIDEIRISKGIARWATGLEPPIKKRNVFSKIIDRIKNYLEDKGAA